MIKIAKHLVFLLPVLFSLGANAQGQTSGQSLDQLKYVIPPSPDASSLGKFADWPTNLYTGLPNIDIPIYELAGRTVKVPISLGYHASGIKVGETASSVGLGWTLNAGGVITRSVVGLPDDDGSAGYLAMRQYYSNPADMSSGTTPYNQDSTFTVNVGEGTADGQPDIFMLNALGRSYKLLFATDGTILTMPTSNLKITCNWSNNTWQVILEDGTQLNFGGNSAMEFVTSLYTHATGDNNGNSVNSTWFLTSIVSPTGETVTFNYTSQGFTQRTGYSQTDYLRNSLNNNPTTPGYGLGYRTGLTTCGCTAQQSVDGAYGVTLINNSVLQTTSTFALSSIETDLLRVDFFLDATGRLDLQGGHALDSIKVFSKYANAYLRTFVLSNSYTSAASSNTIDATAPDSYARYRLHLDSLTEYSTDLSVSKKWKFLYNPMHLPALTSFAQDHLGYFNGAINNTTFLPQILTPLANYCAGFGPPTYLVGDRSFQGGFMAAESLTEIIYPTGGYTILNMEPNSYMSQVDVQQNVGFGDQMLLGMNSPNPWSNVRYDTISISQPQFITINGQALFSTDIANDYGPTTNIAFLSVTGIDPNNGSNGGSLSFNKNTGSLTTTYFLKDPGRYRIGFSMPTISQSDLTLPTSYADLLANFSYRQSLGVQTVAVPVGGLRLKSQFQYDNLNSAAPAIRRYYQYSSPLVLNPVDTSNAYLTQSIYEVGSPDPPNGCSFSLFRSSMCFQNYLVRNSNTKNSLGSVQGGPIGYGQVTEMQDSLGVLGSTVYKFYNFDNDLGLTTAYTFPYAQVCSTDWQRGLLLEKTTYNANQQPLTDETNTYTFVQKPILAGFKSGSPFHYGEIALQAVDFIKVPAKAETQQVQKTSTVETTYDPASGKSVARSTTYFYDNALNMQPTRSLYFGSRGDSVMQYNRTALELTDINNSIPLSSTAIAAADTMVARNIVGPVLETEQYRQSVLALKSLVNYRMVNNVPMPDNVMVQHGSNPIESRLFFRKYDGSGNMTEQAKSADLRHDYIYDYHSTYPIAECIGGDSADLAYTSFEAEGGGGWSFTTADIHWANGCITGNNYYDLSYGACSHSGLNPAKTYIVSYWSYDGSYSVSGSTQLVTGKTLPNQWTYYEHTVTGVSSISVSGAGPIDELRLYPAGAQMTTYTYNPGIGVSSTCDVDNRITYYYYDALGRLAYLKDQDGNITKTIEYHYANR